MGLVLMRHFSFGCIGALCCALGLGWPLASIAFEVPNAGFSEVRPANAPARLDEQSSQVRQPKVQRTPGLKVFGSEVILKSCWSQEALTGKPQEAKSRYRRDISPPKRLQPLQSLAPLPNGWRGSIRRVKLRDPRRKAIALTFDLCERVSDTAGYDARLIDLLRRLGVRATLYIGGKWMRSHPERTWQLMADPLFEIGNHAWTHGNMRVLKGREMRDQVLWTQAQYELMREDLKQKLPTCGLMSKRIEKELAKVQALPSSFRYPYGTCSKEALDFMADQGLPSVQWDVVTGDPSRKQSAKAIKKAMLQGIKPGSIIVAHANGRGWHTAEAMEEVLPMLIRQGYEFVTISELLSLGEPEVASTCYELRPGDNRIYDQKVGRGTD